MALGPKLKAKSAAEIYDPIAVDYAAIKTNPFKRHIEEGSFMSAVGDVDGKGVLDLACGSGYYLLTSQRCRPSISGRWPQPQPLIAAISARSSRTQKSSLTQ